MNSWHALQALIDSPATLSSPNRSELAVYYYLRYQKEGNTTHLTRATTLFHQQLSRVESLLQRQELPVAEINIVALAWLHAQLNIKLINNNYQRVFSALDNYLFFIITETISRNEGVSGELASEIMRYYVERLPDEAATEYLANTVAAVYGRTRKPLSQTRAATVIRLGLDNGLAGELLLLIDVYNAGIKSALIPDTVRSGIAALLSTRREVDFLAGRYSMFPEFVDSAWQDLMFSNNLSWGRGGDLGVSLVLYQAQALLQDAELGKIAELVGLNTLLRTEPESTELTSSQFYHGTAGVAYLYHKLHQSSGNAAYRRGYEYWVSQTEKLLAQELVAGAAAEPAALCGALGVDIILMPPSVHAAQPQASHALEALEMISCR